MVKIQMQYKERSHWTRKSRTERDGQVSPEKKRSEVAPGIQLNTLDKAGGSGLEARRTYEALKEESGKWVEFRDIYIIHAALKKRPQVGESGA